MEKEKEVHSASPIKVGISIGDINGIGPEIIMKALSDARILQDCTPIIYGSTKIFAYYKKLLNDQEFNYQSCKTAEEAQKRKVNVVNVWTDEVEIQQGLATQISGLCSFQALEQATQDLSTGKVDVLVTAPISKEAMGKADFKFPGHTEYLADLSGVEDALMVMVSENLRVALVTTHIALKDVSKTLSKERILQKIKSFDASLRKDFRIVRPKIAVFGLNPHAGENGKMGGEEQEIIIPAINAARNEDILAFGPYPADGFFGSPSRMNYDGILAMYHDQGLTAFKALAFDDGINFTAGLPIVRTSPDHGTAFDIVGQNKASENSMRQAIFSALDIYRSRKFIREIGANPLPNSPSDKKRTSEEVQ
jgi:4-hydroxythreonine-4-phosphate dehydrogenase